MTSMLPKLFVLLSLVSVSLAQLEEIENRPLDGHKFYQGQSFRIECKATTSQNFAIRLACPLASLATGGLHTTSCFENCGRTLCNQPSLNDCTETMPELLVANCSRSVKQITATVQEISVIYTFNLVNPHHTGGYTCQLKTMRSSSYVIVEALTIVSTSSTSPPALTSTSTQTTTATTSSTPTTSTASSAITTTTSARTSSGVSSTVSTSPSTSATKTSPTTTKSGFTSTSSTTKEIYTLPPGPTIRSTSTLSRETTAPEELLLNSAGWFYSSIIGSLSGADIILLCLLIFVLAAWLIGFLCIRCHVLTARYKSEKPTTCCCTAILCLGQQQYELEQKRLRQEPRLANGGLREFAEQERRLGAARLMSMNPRTATSANSVSSGQVYAEPDGASYYSPDGGNVALEQRHPLVLAGDNGADDAYYRLQQDFDDPLSRGGYGTNPRSTFFPRDQTGRHSFQSARVAPRQRPSIPQDMRLQAEEEADAEAEAAADLVAAAADPVITREDFRQRMEMQRREIASLREQLRNSQLQLNQRASSTAALKPPQQQPAANQHQTPTSGDYDFLTRVTAPDALPPSPPPPPPPPQQQYERKQPNSQSLPDDTDLPPLPPPPMVVEADDKSANDQVGNRRGSIGQAYGTGQRF